MYLIDKENDNRHAQFGSRETTQKTIYRKCPNWLACAQDQLFTLCVFWEGHKKGFPSRMDKEVILLLVTQYRILVKTDDMLVCLGIVSNEEAGGTKISVRKSL